LTCCQLKWIEEQNKKSNKFHRKKGEGKRFNKKNKTIEPKKGGKFETGYFYFLKLILCVCVFDRSLIRNSNEHGNPLFSFFGVVERERDIKHIITYSIT
jgi:hypothetical protein